MAMDEPAAPAAQPPSAIGALCDHAGEVWSFFAQVLGQRPIVGDERARHELQAQLHMLLRGSYSWRSETALEFCTRSAVKASEACKQAGAPFDAADFATALWNEFQQERKTILERVESLYAPAVHQCHVHGDLTQTAHDAVRQLVDLLRDLWGVVEWDDWSKRSSGVSNAIHEARVWAVPPVETVKESAAAEKPTPAAVIDDEWAVIAKALSGNEPDVLVYLDVENAHSAGAVCDKSTIGEELDLTPTQVDRAVRALRKKKLAKSHSGRKGGVYLLANGRNVAAWVSPNNLKNRKLWDRKKAAQPLRRAQ